MIFPELPRRYRFELLTVEHSTSTIQTNVGPRTAKAPLHGVETVTAQSRIDREQWWRDHGLTTDPAAHSRHSEPIDWLARDAIEFYLLCTGMLAWCVYWYGVHRGVW